MSKEYKALLSRQLHATGFGPVSIVNCTPMLQASAAACVGHRLAAAGQQAARLRVQGRHVRGAEHHRRLRAPAEFRRHGHHVGSILRAGEILSGGPKRTLC